MIWLQIIATILFAWIDAWVDAKRWIKKQKIYHVVEGAARAIALFFISGWDWKVFILLIGVFWIPFELILYAKRGVPWNYVGTTDFLDKLWRKLFPANTGYYVMGVKILLLAIGILINIYEITF